jgi:hypothetical protein
MSNSKWILSLIALGLVAGRGTAESQRPLFTVENAFPRWEQVEVGTRVQYVEVEETFGDSSVTYAGPYVRYGLMEKLAMNLDVPFASTDPAFGDSESGLGDIGVGFQLRAYEDIFGYPYFIPHVHVSLPTGDDDKGLGAGDPVYTLGLSYGDKVYDFLSWVLDLGYRINPEIDNQLLLSTSLLWHVSPQFTLIGEARYEDNAGSSDDSDDSLVLVAGGMSYNWTDALQMGVHVGGALTGDVNTLSEFRLSYSF